MDEESLEKNMQIILVFIIVVILMISGYYVYLIMNMEEPPAHEQITHPGEYSKLYLQDDIFSSILIEVDYVEGANPDSESLNLLVDTLENVCDKSSISYVLSDAIDESDTTGVYSVDYIHNLEKEYRDYYNSNSTIIIYILYLNGRYDESENTLGISYLASSFAVFKNKIEDIDIPRAVRLIVGSRDFENSVVIHETGHLLGLVNLNYQSPRNHEDSSSGSENHCVNEDCVMYYALENSRSSFMEKFWTDRNSEALKPPKTFGPDCFADLEDIKNNDL